LLLFLGGCASSSVVRAYPDATTGIHDARFASLASAHWSWAMESDPLYATELGIHDFDDRLADNSAAGRARELEAVRSFRDQLAPIVPTLTSSTDRTSAELLLGALDARIGEEVCEFDSWSISANSSPVSRWNYLPELHTVTSPSDGADLLARYRGIAATIDNDIANLRRGLAAGRTANAESVRRVITMTRTQLEQPHDKWPLVAPKVAGLSDVVFGEIEPALRRYLALLETEIAPRARASDKTGLGALPGGDACYRSQIKKFTALDLDPKATHEAGLAEIARIDQEITALAARALSTTDLASALDKLRNDKSLYFSTAEEVEAKARDSLARANAAVPKYFGILPKAECIVSRVPDYDAPYTTIAYYRQPVPDGSKPGQYFVNVYKPETRPRYEATVLAFHESVPGHHLQIAIAQERSQLPAFRKNLDATAFVEGWALYTERLADQMGLYVDDLDRLGVLSFDAWRASRLVVDTGIHAFGWSREQAIAFMMAHTALAQNNIENEVDRYIVWPAQALSYKTGQREILRLRADAEARLGARFSLPAFHDVVLGQGSVTLPVLGRAVEAWVASQVAQ